MFTFVRAVVYSTLFIGLLLVFLPAQVVTRSGVASPDGFGVEQGAGLFLAIAGGILGERFSRVSARYWTLTTRARTP